MALAKTVATILLGTVHPMLQAQIELSQQVLGTFGESFLSPPYTAVGFTAGEPVVRTISSTQYTLTQGFHQPKIAGILYFEVLTVDASCPTSSDGEAYIETILGCDPPYVIQWSTGEIGPNVDRLRPGTYTVTIISGRCSREISFTIGSGPVELCRLQIFNAFSPNGDGVNDTWVIENIERPEFSDNRVEIYNRWGQLIWKGSGYNNEDQVWKGTTMNGSKLPDGTYFYMINVAGTRFKGYVEITR